MSDRNYIAKLIDEFDPNENAKTPFATYIPNRSGPSFKTHTTRAHAMNAFAHRPYGALYVWEGSLSFGHWELVAKKIREDHNHTCDYCGCDTLSADPNTWYGWHSTGPRSRGVATNGTSGPYDHGAFVFQRVNRKLVEPLTCLFCCPNCFAQFAP